MSTDDMGRRGFLRTAAASLAAGQARSAKVDNRIVQENSRAGAYDWQLQRTELDDPTELRATRFNRRTRSSASEGYVSKTSVLPGESMDIMLSMAPAGGCIIDFYRMGYYDGAGARHMGRLGPLKVATQPTPMMSTERLRECRWEPASRFSIPKEWPSGVYLGKLTRDEKCGPQSYVVFVVKEHRSCDLLYGSMRCDNAGR